MKNSGILLSIVLIAASKFLFAQDDLLKTLEMQQETHSEKVIATFKGDKIINIETNETVKKSNLDFRVSHLFGNVGKESGGGIHDFYGLDESADIRIAFHYGITDKLMVGISRAKRDERLAGLVKYRLLEQTTDNKIPFALTFFGNMTYSTKDKVVFEKGLHRFSYYSEAIIARKFSRKFSFILAAGYMHRNFVFADDVNDTYHLSGGFRIKFTPSSSFIADYAHAFGRNDLAVQHYDIIGTGIEIETGGHVFTVMFTNASGLLPNDFLVNTTDSWGKGGFKLSFIISRMFPLGKRNTVSPGKK